MNPQQAAMVQAAMANAKAQQAMYAGVNMNVEGKTGSEIIALVKQGNVGLLTKFIQNNMLYQNDPESVHNNIDLFLKSNAQMYGQLFMKVANKKPSVMIPHIAFFMQQMRSDPQYSTLTVQVLDGIATENPNLIYPYITEIRDICGSQQSGDVVYSKLVGKLAKCTGVVANGPDFAFGLLIEILEKPYLDNYIPAVVLAEVSNIMTSLSSKQLLINAMPTIARHRSGSEVVFTSINDYANDRSLQKVSEKVDLLEQRVNQLNGDVSRTCANMADVIAYVDANMADMKDFLAEVVKKLPQPARLQVDGTLRKTLILVFVCCDTGLEYGITSTEWSKWLKIGFSLVKAGTAVIDLGMGNPLGILKKGVDCVQEIYKAYKTNDDDEFNTYITHPFLTSSEQDKLLEKLREQDFFNKFAYNAQKHGWYLINPQRDGQTKFNAADMGLRNGVAGVAGALVGAAVDALPISGDAKTAVNTVAGAGISVASTSIKASGGDSTKLNNNSAAPAAGNTNPMHNNNQQAHISGGRAAAMKETLKDTYGSSVVTAADAKVEQATVQAASNAVQADLVKRVEAMEGEIKTLKSKVNALEHNTAKKGGCIIA